MNANPTSPNIAAASHALLLWRGRKMLLRVFAAGALLSTTIALTLPVRYESKVSILPPETPAGGAAMLAAMAGRVSNSPSLGMLAGGLMGGRSNGELFMDLLRSGSVGGSIAERFHLQQVYGKRYNVDVLKKLAQRTDIKENKKSGVITIAVTDSDRSRAQALASAYVDELNRLLVRVNTSSAHRERLFVEARLASVNADLQDAQVKLSAFSAAHRTVDIKEQTRAMVDAGARLQGQLIAGESQLEALRQIYGDSNVRVRSAEGQVNVLRREVQHMAGSSGDAAGDAQPEGALYPPLRELPALGVQWANLYRRVRAQETVFDLLSAQYETARIQEARELPSVSVVDAAGWPEKKSWPPRTLIVLAGTALCTGLTCFFLIARDRSPAYAAARKQWLAMRSLRREEPS